MENDELKTTAEQAEPTTTDAPAAEPAPEQQTEGGQDHETQQEPEQPSVAKAIDDLGIGPEEPLAPEPSSADEQKAQAPGAGKADPAAPKVPKEDVASAGAKAPTDDELLAGVKSERGKERLSKLLAEGRQNAETLQAMQRTISSAGLDRESFSNFMEISRLVSSPDPDDIERGLKAFEDVRTRMYQSLGREAPGVDLLAQYPDLAQKVAGMSMSREDALQIMQARQAKAAEKERYAAQKAQQQELSRIQTFGQQVQQVFQARSQKADFDARIEVLKKHFSKPGAVQQFVAANPPENWGKALMWMYDNVQPQQQAAATPSPITQNRARTAGLRVTGTTGGSVDSIEARIRELGL